MSEESRSELRARRIMTGFEKATEYMPELPQAGILDFIGNVCNMIDKGASLRELINDPQPTLLSRVVKAANVAHRDVGIAPVPHLREKTELTIELVKSAAIYAIATLAIGDDSIFQSSDPPDLIDIRPIDPDDNEGNISKAEEFLSEYKNRRLVLEMVQDITNRLTQDDLLGILDIYKENIVGISDKYTRLIARITSGPGTEEYISEYNRLKNDKDQEINGQRRFLLKEITPAVREVLGPYSSRPGVKGFGDILVRATPSRELFLKHKVEPPEGLN